MTEGAPPHPASKGIHRTVREPHQQIILAVYASGRKDRIRGRPGSITERASDAEDCHNKRRVLAVATTLPPRVHSIRNAHLIKVVLLEDNSLSAASTFRKSDKQNIAERFQVHEPGFPADFR